MFEYPRCFTFARTKQWAQCPAHCPVSALNAASPTAVTAPRWARRASLSRIAASNTRQCGGHRREAARLARARAGLGHDASSEARLRTVVPALPGALAPGAVPAQWAHCPVSALNAARPTAVTAPRWARRASLSRIAASNTGQCGGHRRADSGTAAALWRHAGHAVHGVKRGVSGH
jgi:hypothetical protein